jgi:hypothetical protein
MAESKRKLLADLNELVDKLRDQDLWHRKEISSLEKFMTRLTTIIEKEAPEFLGKMTELCDTFRGAFGHERDILAAEQRLMEDLNDIAARFDVVYRTSMETADTRMVVKDCRAKIADLRKALEEDQAKGGLKRFKFETEIKEAVEQKREAIRVAEAKLIEFISVKQNYNTFKVRRFRNGFGSLGRAMAAGFRGEVDALNDLAHKISEAREGIDILLDGGTLTSTPAPVKEADAVAEASGVAAPVVEAAPVASGASDYERFPYSSSPFDPPSVPQPVPQPVQGFGVYPGYGSSPFGD